MICHARFVLVDSGGRASSALLPYAHALEAHGHEVKIAGPVDIAEPLSAAGLAHARFDHPGDATLAPIWARFRGASPDETLGIAIREIFAGLNSKVALPGLMDTIDSWRPDLVVRDSGPENPDGTIVAVIHNSATTDQVTTLAVGGASWRFTMPASGFATVVDRP